MKKRLIPALLIGLLLTGGLFGLSLLAANAGLESLARGLLWPNTLLQGLAPLGNIGTPERPIYEGTPLNFLAFLASIPLGLVIYTAAAYVILGWRGRRS
jgi:hypothetical protein